MPNPGRAARNHLQQAVWLGTAMLGSALVLTTVLSGSLFGINRGVANYQLPLAIGVLAGFVTLIAALAGLVLIYNALGLSDSTSALGLPSGSIRALLALALVIVFIGVCSVDLIDPTLFAPNSPRADTAKQILSIAATALTTIVGFYFGSNAANEAFSNASQTNQAASATPPTLDGLTQQAAGIKQIADGLQQKLDAAKDPDPDRIGQQNPDPTALADLNGKLAAVLAQVTAAGVDRDRAARLVADATADAGKLGGSATTMQQYTADAGTAQTAFAAALSAYTAARDALLAMLAKG